MKTMVDTIKLLMPIPDPKVISSGSFSPYTVEQFMRMAGTHRTYINPSPIYAKLGKYMPRLTLHRRPSKTIGVSYQLAIEFSAPKMLYGNNFDELEEKDFTLLLAALREKLLELLGIRFFDHQLASAKVGAWHPSKNIVFMDYTSCQTILSTIAKLDISKIYDLQDTNFRDGRVIHIHTNSKDIAFYDKLADLRKAKTSNKRAFEDDGAIQMNLLASIEEYHPIEIFRYEIRLIGIASIKRAYPELEVWTFETLFKRQLCKRLLVDHWLKFTSSIDMLSLDTSKPYELLQNYLIENPSATPQAAMAAVAGLLISGHEGVPKLRNLLESRYGKQAWRRVKPLLKNPSANRYKHFQHIDEALERFTPTRMTKFLSNIENSVK